MIRTLEMCIRDRFNTLYNITLPIERGRNLAPKYVAITSIIGSPESPFSSPCTTPVSYTHLDVYKRQGISSAHISILLPTKIKFEHSR